MTDIKEPQAEPETPSGENVPIDKVVFGVAAALAAAFVIIGAVWPEQMGEETTEALTWVTGNFGWLFVLTSAGFVLFSAYLAVTRYGNLKLGPDDSEPEFSHVLVGLDDVRDRHGHRPDVLGRRRAAHPPQRPAAGRWRARQRRGGRARRCSTPTSTGASTPGRCTP